MNPSEDRPDPGPATRSLRFLLIGPYDPHGGEYTFLAPPLGVWRLCGALEGAGIEAQVFDPNNAQRPVLEEFEEILRSQPWDLIGVSTTAMTLRYDLQLAQHARRYRPNALLVAGGMEASFNSELLFSLCPFDLIVLGEGEKPLLAMATRLRAGAGLEGILGTARMHNGSMVRLPQAAMTHEELRAAIFATPYERMPYRDYWQRLEHSYRVHQLPSKADREARLAEMRSVRLNTLNYCPMACSFCSSTNFLSEAQGSTARVARLDADECMHMIRRIVRAHPDTRTIIFQDDIFVFTKDPRVLPLCDAIVAAKASGELPAQLQFISTNRIDSMTAERLAAMRRAGFRVAGYGIENFSRRVLEEFNKGLIHRHIEPALTEALAVGITPFLDLILTSPRSDSADLAENLRQAFHWIQAGCEVGMYPYVIPFSGAALARDPALRPQTVFETISIPGSMLSWRQATKILPRDALARELILEIEELFERALRTLSADVPHVPSRVRSLLWIACATGPMLRVGHAMPALAEVLEALASKVPATAQRVLALIRAQLESMPAAMRLRAAEVA
jgi:radical SAM superfamily enzyme YgiQ (UPF0313 family)